MHTDPYSQLDFEFTTWTPKQMTELASKVYDTRKSSLEAVYAIPAETRTFENTVYALMHTDGQYEGVFAKLALLGEVSPKEAIRTKVHELQMEYTPKFVDLELTPDMYRAVREYIDGTYKKEKKTLRPDEIKCVTDTEKELIKAGFALPKDKQKENKTLIKKLSQASQQFHKNINDYEDFILVTDEELASVPTRVIESLEIDKESGKKKVSLKYPEIGPFMQYAENRSKRKELALKSLKKGGKQNVKLLASMVELRTARAKLLGYATHADYKTDGRMARNASTVLTFVDSIMTKVQEGAKTDMKETKAFAKTLGIKDFAHYDNAFVTDKLRKSQYEYDPEMVRAYFPLDVVMARMFAHFGNLFGLSFVSTFFTLWHKDVMSYEVRDAATDSLIGYMTFDLFPRTGKYGHACAIDVVTSHEKSYESDTRVAPYTVMLCNFPAPKKVGKKVTPSTLSLGEVETLFHEFGHALHMTLSQVRIAGQSGANVAWDFVEAPSQIMENWVWNEKCLKMFSSHKDTGESLPDELIAQVLKAKYFHVASATLQQSIFAHLDMKLHTGKCKDPQKEYRTLMKKYMGIELPEKETLFPASFGHMAGYDAGYYSYHWALVYAQDAFSLFEDAGLENAELGRKWRTEVLEKGSSQDEMKSLKNFLGRTPNNKAFLREVLGGASATPTKNSPTAKSAKKVKVPEKKPAKATVSAGSVTPSKKRSVK